MSVGPKSTTFTNFRLQEEKFGDQGLYTSNCGEETVCTEPAVSVLALLYNEVSNRSAAEHLEIRFK